LPLPGEKERVRSGPFSLFSLISSIVHPASAHGV
jgi:hypothetical protein